MRTTEIAARDDDVWQGHPDIADFHGKLHVVYRQSGRHTSDEGASVMLTRKTNEWGSKDDWEKPVEIGDSGPGARYNCPRIMSLGGRRLWIICDFIRNEGGFSKSEQTESCTDQHVWWSDDGKEWVGPIPTGIVGIVPDRIIEHLGKYYVGTHIAGSAWRQMIWEAESPTGPWVLVGESAHPELKAWGNNTKFCELSLCSQKVEGNDRLICLMRENSGKGLPAAFTYSWDCGRTWIKPRRTRLWGCHRPVLGKLLSGKFLVTYREQSSSFFYWAKNTFAYLCLERFVNSEEPFSNGTILPLDHDRAAKSDGGYTGWVQTGDGNIHVVNYITDDAPKPYIRKHTLREEDF
jgi:sialidase-1